MASSHSPSDPTYTVYIRLPFPRGDFVDPPPVNWDSSKDEALWKIVSKVSKTEIDWNEVASRFQVTVDFLLQQVAFLTERHAAQLRAQMRKAAAAARGSAAPSPQPGSESPFVAEAMLRTGSGGPQPRAPSSLSIRKDSHLARNDVSVPGTPVRNSSRPTVTRTSSSNTAIVGTRNLAGSGRAANRSSTETQRKRLSSLPVATSVDEVDPPDPPSPGPADASPVDSSSSASSSPAQSRIIRRPPRFQNNDVSASFAEDDDEDTEPAFLPYKAQADGSTSGQHDLSATLRGNPRDFARRLPREHIHHSETSDSSASSAVPVEHGASDRNQPRGPVSPRRTMELSGRSPSAKGKGYSRDSDGTPSMGSSFSDLDDASVTQSALEEALASKMGDVGTIGSLKGTIGNVFRSRYLPKSYQP
ncbi:hypothetical protein DL766_007426 [Monosporascus sp. MC13-8B]|uniref:Autophagy-related protein 29 n=1 Tax=Monosporascus cannonballus TaxID=155416 RepID=A0ABY0H285_9PEZI|nr:hypothetical protein DL762_007905 [Monosporascus cannonballus]RYP23887.1 hypothetical protein DL766_007426 [Monosporascus sp. MC13-8B]